MQFKSQPEVDKTTKKVTFDFFDKLKYPAKSKFRELFYYLGARFIRGQRDSWEFPNFVSNETISEIIHNTCFECGGLMGNGIAIQNGVLKAPGDRESSICYTPYVDPNNHSVINVRKCTVCGHSHTQTR